MYQGSRLNLPMGYLGIHDVEVKNNALLGTWLFKLLTEDDVWKTLLRRKHVCSKQCPKYIGSLGTHTMDWSNGYEEIFSLLWILLCEDGMEIRFWEEKWLSNFTFREQYPALYNIVQYKGDTIAMVLESSECDVQIRFNRPQTCIME